MIFITLQRDALSEDKKATNRDKDNKAKKKKRDADRQHQRPNNDKEKEYMKPAQYYKWQRNRRLIPRENAGAYFHYLLDTLHENIETDGGWKYNIRTKETLMASEFQTLAKRYAVAFQQLGI